MQGAQTVDPLPCRREKRVFQANKAHALQPRFGLGQQSEAPFWVWFLGARGECRVDHDALAFNANMPGLTEILQDFSDHFS